MARFIKLYNGKKMPLVGMGTWNMTNPTQDQASLEHALNIGYRHIDTAYKYQSEEIVGRAIHKWMNQKNNKREDLFLVTKLPWIGMQADLVDHFIELSLKKLQTNYVDLYLVHWPFGLKYKGDDQVAPTKNEQGDLDLDMSTDIVEVWKAMERQVSSGKAISIGLSNFNTSQIERIMEIASVKPANLQVEVHAYFQQTDLQETCRKHGITITAYGPLGSPGRAIQDGRNLPALMKDESIMEIANFRKKLPSQVLLRFLVQQNIAVIPKSSNVDRMTQNFNIFDFELTEEEMQRIKNLDQGELGRSFREFPSATHHPEYPFPY